MGLVVMDLEVKERVTDWAAARKGACGVSVMAVYDFEAARYFLYDDHNLEAGAFHLENADAVISFNGKEFDIPCLAGYIKRPLQIRTHYDILQEVWAALGSRQKGYSLGGICERTLGVGKSGAGAMAPDLFQAGRFAELATYCMADVALTTSLYEHIMETGHIVDHNGDKLCLRPYEEALIGQ